VSSQLQYLWLLTAACDKILLLYLTCNLKLCGSYEKSKDAINKFSKRTSNLEKANVNEEGSDPVSDSILPSSEEMISYKQTNKLRGP
jgi:hypothetical protein